MTGTTDSPGAPDAGPRDGGLPRRTPGRPVRPRDRVPLETLEATLSGLHEVDDTARPAVALEPPPEVWAAVTGAVPRVQG